MSTKRPAEEEKNVTAKKAKVEENTTASRLLQQYEDEDVEEEEDFDGEDEEDYGDEEDDLPHPLEEERLLQVRDLDRLLLRWGDELDLLPRVLA